MSGKDPKTSQTRYKAQGSTITLLAMVQLGSFACAWTYSVSAYCGSSTADGAGVGT